jgi:glutathione S-transferase
MRYELYYWPSIQGRGEFVRLALEQAGADYVDVARLPARGRKGMPAMLRLLDDTAIECPPFAPPILKAGDLVIAQAANILLYLGRRHGLAPRAEAGQLWVNQLQLTIADFIVEIHETHHPLGPSMYYEEQKAAARRRTADFIRHRMPKFLDYFERVLGQNTSRGGYLAGGRLSYADLSAFQVMAGLRYAFPKAMARAARKYSRLGALHDRVAALPRVAAYLASKRRIPFNEDGIFRHYPELDR